LQWREVLLANGYCHGFVGVSVVRCGVAMYQKSRRSGRMYRHYDAPKPSEGIRDKRKEDATDRHFLNFAPSRENVTEAPRKVTPKLHH
jgi:hypothetical protein